MRLHYWEPSENFNPASLDSDDRQELEDEGRICTTITGVKEMIKAHGGTGYTEHYERDGTLFEVTAIELNKNNSTHKYNQHL